MRTNLLRPALFVALGLIGLPVFAQAPSLEDRVEALERANAALEERLDALEKAKAAAPPAPRPSSPVTDVSVEIPVDGRPVKGSDDATVTLVELSDYQCPFCARYVRNTLPQLIEQYVETGKIRYVFVDLPLESIHKLAFRAAETAGCAGEQGKFWEMHDRLFEYQRALEPWSGHAEAVGLDVEAFQGCLDSGRQAESVHADLELARTLGVTGTPTFFLARHEPGAGTVTGTKKLRGAQPLSVFQAAIDELLAAPAE